MFELATISHRRFNPLLDEWILVSPQRATRPWQGQVERPASPSRPAYDPACYLCPGNKRAGGEKNPHYSGTHVFTNDFAALTPGVIARTADSDLLFRAVPESGTCRVVCFSPRHDLSLPDLSNDEIRAVVRVWVAQTAELGQRFRWVQVFENKGEVMGSSNPHPHGQIWATASLPNLVSREDTCQRAYIERTGSPMVGDYLEREALLRERTVVENEHWLAVVPFWAIWPFETLLMPRRRVTRLPDLSDQEQRSLASILKRLLTKYDNLFDVSFPYSMGWHGAPYDARDHAHWWLHAHFLPPLLRSATVKKFMVGYELLAEAQRDLTPESAAERLRAMPEERKPG